MRASVSAAIVFVILVLMMSPARAAITVTTIASVGNKTAEASTASPAVSPGAAVGDLVLVSIGADNAGTNGVSSVTGVSDSKGNTYTPVKEQNRTAASAANDGCTVSLYQSILTAALVSGIDTITVSFSPNTTAKAIVFSRVTGANTSNYANNSAAGSGASFTSGGATPSLATADLIVGVAANESGTAPGTDTDTTNGLWDNFGQASGGTGGDATKMGVRFNWKVVTGAGAQTYDGSTGASTDWAALYALYAVSGGAPPAPPMRSLLGVGN